MEQEILYEVTIIGNPYPFVIKELKSGKEYPQNAIPDQMLKESLEFLNAHTVFYAPNLYDCPENRRGHYEWKRGLFIKLYPAFERAEIDKERIKANKRKWLEPPIGLNK